MLLVLQLNDSKLMEVLGRFVLLTLCLQNSASLHMLSIAKLHFILAILEADDRPFS